MLAFRQMVVVSLLLAGTVAVPAVARAAQSYDNCAGFIDTLPATIATQGVWCLRHDLATGVASGAAITIATNNVTIDCNDFKIGGLAAGDATHAYGIYAVDRLNATVRHCNIRGFWYGVLLQGSGGGHVIEDSRFDNNRLFGVYVGGDGSVVRRNRVNDTGGSSASPGQAYAIHTDDAVDVIDNTVDGVLPLPSTDGSATAWAYGIVTTGNPSGSISGNRVRGLVPLGTGATLGIFNGSSGRITLLGNRVVGDGSTGSIGLKCETTDGRARDNTVNGFDTGISGCTYGGGDGNVVVAP